MAYAPNPDLLKKSDLMGKAQFGMDQEQIKALKGGEPFSEGQGHYYLIAYVQKLGGLPCLQVYGFSDNKLLYIYYEILNTSDNLKLAPVEDYQAWFAALKMLYGPPAVIKNPWENDPELLKRIGREKIGEYSWEEPTYILSLLLYPGSEEGSPTYRGRGHIAIYLIDNTKVKVDS